MKPRVLVTISFSFSIRYIIRTGFINEIKSFCEPVIAFTWNEEQLIQQLRNDGFEVYIIPAAQRSASYNDTRRKIDYWFDTFQLKSKTSKIQAKYLRQYQSYTTMLFSKSRKLYNQFKFFIPGYTKKLFSKEDKLLLSDTNYTALYNWQQKLNIDAVFTVTPFHKQEDLLLRACSKAGKKMLTSILSFDNITKRGWIPVNYNLYAVWNNENKTQLKRIYPTVKNENIHIIGAPQFDFYFKKEFLYCENEWKKIVGLPAKKRKIILYAGGPEALFPNEPQYLKHIDEAISSGLIKSSPIILFRCHPIDHVERWKKIIGNSVNVFFDESWTGRQEIHSADITVEDIKKLSSTLAFTDVHINLCSTMTVDGSAFNKPQIGPAYDEQNHSNERLLQDMYLQEHFLPIIKKKGIRLANSKMQLILLINEALEAPQTFTVNSYETLKEIITYSDGKSTYRIISVVKNFVSMYIQ